MEEVLWKLADELRGSVEPVEYKHVVLGLLFLEFASDKFVAQRQKLIKLLFMGMRQWREFAKGENKKKFAFNMVKFSV